VGGSPALKKAVDQLVQAAASDLTILVIGESGTGKELAAHMVHLNSTRSKGPFVAVNCSAFPHDLLESELFGHRRGAFTGAVRDHDGRFVRAHGGTLFLDEIGDLPLTLQPKLLRVLEDAEVDPLGASSPVQVDVRLVAATHRDLPSMVETGAFRRDLFYRLNVFPVTLPPLRERPEDIPELVRHLAARRGRPDLVIDDGVARKLASHTWPGNVRELDNLVARWLLVAGDRAVTEDDLPAEVLRVAGPAASTLPGLRDQERALIERALAESGQNQSRAAERLGIPRHVLIYRMRKYGLGPYGQG
jgi:two-component system NtrC family response regulator